MGAVERRYPRGPEAAFQCSDEGLNRIWEMGARTLDLAPPTPSSTARGGARTWVGDACVETLVALVAGTDWRLVKRNLVISSQGRRADGLLTWVATGDEALIPLTIPEFSLHWIRTLARYYEYSGDTSTVEELLPAAADVLAAFERSTVVKMG